jgi:hypothetical protein
VHLAPWKRYRPGGTNGVNDTTSLLYSKSRIYGQVYHEAGSWKTCQAPTRFPPQRPSQQTRQPNLPHLGPPRPISRPSTCVGFFPRHPARRAVRSNDGVTFGRLALQHSRRAAPLEAGVRCVF